MSNGSGRQDSTPVGTISHRPNNRKATMSNTFQLPAGFLWGASTAAHQIEGMNVNSDFGHSSTAAYSLSALRA